MSNYLPLIVRQTLFKTGWNENEIIVYSTLLEKGAMNLTDLSTEVSIVISTLQKIKKKLVTKKMIKKGLLNDNPIYIAMHIDQLNKWMKGYGKKLDQHKNIIDLFVNQYDFNPQMYTPKVRLFEGIKGVKNSYKHMLDEIKSKEIINYFYITDDVNYKLQTFFDETFIPARMNKKIFFKSLVIKTTFVEKYTKKDNKELRKIKFLSGPLSLKMNTEINIYDNFMHCMSCNKDSTFAMIIENLQMAELQKTVFNQMWSMT